MTKVFNLDDLLFSELDGDRPTLKLGSSDSIQCLKHLRGGASRGWALKARAQKPRKLSEGSAVRFSRALSRLRLFDRVS